MPLTLPRLRACATVLSLAAACMGPVHAGYFDDRRFPILTDADFPADEYILSQARFWYSIYIEVGDDEGLLHDPFYPDLVFRKAPAPGQGRAGSKMAEAQVKALQAEIRGFLAKDTSAWTPEERKLRSVFPLYWDSTAIGLSCDRIRFQRGLKSKYRAGLERSYRYLDLIDSVFAAEGVPSRLKYLPHVESSFYPFAYSKVGAAGMWQFMKSSAKRYKMKVGYQIDERRDPLASTVAAARMLAFNRSMLQSWPLAIVAYNHGPGGLANAARSTGTRDLSTIIKSYYSNTFGFASKNFYAEFLAASSIAMQADSLFPGLRKMEPLRYRHLVLQKPVGTKLICTVTGLSPEELEEYNLALRPATFRGNGLLPKGFALRLPAGLDLGAIALRLGGAEVPGERLAAATAKTGPKASAAASPAPGPVAAGAPSVEPAPVSPAVASAGSAAPEVVRAQTVSPPPALAANPGVVPSAVTDTSPPPPIETEAEPDKSENLAAQANPMEPGAPPKPRLRERMRARLAEKRGEAAEKPQPVLASEPPPAAAVPPGAKPGKPAPAAPARAAVPAPLPQSAALPKPETVAQAPAPAAPPPERVVDSTLALQASDLDKLAHPMDRFNPAVYRLEYAYENGMLVFQAGPDETLSHYAEWAGLSEAALRRSNGIRNPRDFRLGRRIKIPLGEEKAKEFMKRREENYRAIEEDFYGNYYVAATEPLPVGKGLNLWTWSQEQEIPFWLLQKHNPGKALDSVHPGDTLNLPVIETGVRKWGFTRYANTREYLQGVARYLATGKPEP